MKYIAKVRYTELMIVEDFVTEEEGLHKGSVCIVTTERGMEMGVVVESPRPIEDRMEVDHTKVLLRKLTEEDESLIQKILEEEKKAYAFAKERIQDRKMNMKLSKVDHLLDGKKIIFYFLADGRVDFRALVRDLAKQYKTRIEMRQIGSRDEARILGDVGHCGQPLCCTRFIKDFDPITMKMAKNQKASLDSRKISGVCGKLLCCLKYEDPLYTEALKDLPNVGDTILTTAGEGEVMSLDPLRGVITIRIEKKGKVEVKKEDWIRHPQKRSAQEEIPLDPAFSEIKNGGNLPAALNKEEPSPNSQEESSSTPKKKNKKRKRKRRRKKK
ncbi:MAG: stage 0 sporulation protein [Planctomycetota bacterium]|nr:MAG: stage 0 sporulation protein [Planctomycetota bacterium]